MRPVITFFCGCLILFVSAVYVTKYGFDEFMQAITKTLLYWFLVIGLGGIFLDSLKEYLEE